MIGAWTDSALYGAQGEVLDNDSDLEGYDKHKCFLQRGAFLAILSKDHLDHLGDVPLSLMDWRTRASKRVLHATFAAESDAAAETHGLAEYFRAYWCDVLLGHVDWINVTEFGEDHVPIILFTD